MRVSIIPHAGFRLDSAVRPSEPDSTQTKHRQARETKRDDNRVTLQSRLQFPTCRQRRRASPPRPETGPYDFCFCADRRPRSDLFRPLSDRNQHDIHDSDPANDKPDRRSTTVPTNTAIKTIGIHRLLLIWKPFRGPDLVRGGITLSKRTFPASQ